MIAQVCEKINNKENTWEKLYIRYKQYESMQDIKRERERERERVERKDSNTNTRICFKVRATALRPRLHTEVFPLCPHMTFHKETSIEELQLNTGSIQLLSLNTNASTQEGRHKA